MKLSPPRIAVYGRHSSDKQNPSSSQDQVEACQKLIDYLGGTVVDTFLDAEVSGYRRNRLGLQRMLTAVERGQLDIIVAESLDRLARDSEDIAWLAKKLTYHQVRIHTVAENEIDEIKIGVASLLGSLFLSNLQKKTVRGMEAAVLAGRFAGGRAYGYRLVDKVDTRGQRIKGLLEISPEQADIVEQIFADFSAGMSAIQIAKKLNMAGIPGPRGGQWNASTIRGAPKKAVGILNNPLYVGRLVWNRRQWRRNPESEQRERRYRLRDPSEWVEIDVPDLRIFDQTLWDAVQDQLKARQKPRTVLAEKRRPKHLLSGLIKCSVCGANYVVAGRDYYKCASTKERGTCHNTLSVRRPVIEQAVLSTLQSSLLSPAQIDLFVEEYRREAARLTRTQDLLHASTIAQIDVLERQISNLLANFAQGVVSPRLAHMLEEKEAELAQLQQQATSPAPVLTPTMPDSTTLARLYREKVANLTRSLEDEAIRPQATAIIRQIIHSVTIYPSDQPEAEVASELGRLIDLAANENSPGFLGRGCSVSVVAGAGFTARFARVDLRR
ncbi:recombinase family protein [Pedomonas sp. V897]|uniref:recombinase family protein n=1 Tax=Pedomonas sp. V897 TaxID=3446482 RepID=UPI003EE37145